jgi:hypothetical protein
MTIDVARCVYITRLRLENIRAFRHLAIDMRDEDGSPRMLSVVIGRNGTCKSTLLRCVAIALSQRSDASALLAHPNSQMVSEGAEHGQIWLQLVDATGESSEVHCTLENQGGRDILADSEETSGIRQSNFVCGYGAGRSPTAGRATSTRSAYRTMDSVLGLFDYQLGFADVELTLRRMEDHLGSDLYPRALAGIKRALGLGDDHRIGYAKGGGIRISGPDVGQEIPFDGWADGYRMTFSWLIDLYGWAMQADAITPDGGVRGVLLIDEVEQHLHPAMQSGLLPELRKALPDMQVLATTHSPLAALGTESDNIVALHRIEKHVQRAVVPDLTGYSTDDALVEEALFGTDPYPQTTQAKLNRYRDLASIAPEARSEAQAQEIQSLARQLNPAKLPALREDPIAHKLDELTQLLRKEAES